MKLLINPSVREQCLSLYTVETWLETQGLKLCLGGRLSLLGNPQSSKIGTKFLKALREEREAKAPYSEVEAGAESTVQLGWVVQ